MDNQDKISTFIALALKKDETYAYNLLESNNWDLEKALELDKAINSDESIENDISSKKPDLSEIDFSEEPSKRKPDSVKTEQLLPSNGPNIFHNIHELTPMAQVAANEDDLIFNTLKAPEYLNENKSFSHVRELATKEHKLLLVCIKNQDTLSNIHFNRDIWCNNLVSDIAQPNYICWQQNIDSFEGNRFSTLYNIIDFPYIGIIEAETGKLLHTIKQTKDYLDFISEISEFIDNHSKETEEKEFKKAKIEDKQLSEETSIEDTAVERDDVIASSVEDTDSSASKQDIPKPNNIDDRKSKEIMDEPTSNYSLIRIKFSDNSKTITRKFSNLNKLQIIYDFITQEYGNDNFDILNIYPKKSLKSQKNIKIKKLNLHNSTIIVQYE